MSAGSSLALNIRKIKEVIVDFHKSGPDNHIPIYQKKKKINDEAVEGIANFKFVGLTALLNSAINIC